MSKRQKDHNENHGLQFVDMSGPPTKRARRIAQVITDESRVEAQRVWQERQEADTAARVEFEAERKREEEAARLATSKIRVDHVLHSIKAAGYGSLYEFLEDLVTTKDPHHSSQVSQMLIYHGEELLDSIRARRPDIVAQWIRKVAGDILADEGAKLAQHLRPPQGQSVTETLENFSLAQILADAEDIAPTLCYLLHLETYKIQSFWPERENNDCAVPARDLMEAGAAYANTARAFKTFRADNRKATNLGTEHGVAPEVNDGTQPDEEQVNYDNYGEDLELDLGDLALDSEEFPAGVDPQDFVAMAQEALAAMDDLELDEELL